MQSKKINFNKLAVKSNMAPKNFVFFFLLSKQKFPRKKNQYGGDFQDCVCTFLLHENIFCERFIRYIKLIFGVSTGVGCRRPQCWKWRDFLKTNSKKRKIDEGMKR
jgi:hypothetical protein